MGFFDSKSSSSSSSLSGGLDLGASTTQDAAGDAVNATVGAQATGGSVQVGGGDQIVLTGNVKSSVTVEVDKSNDLTVTGDLTVNNSTELVDPGAFSLASQALDFANANAELFANATAAQRAYESQIYGQFADTIEALSGVMTTPPAAPPVVNVDVAPPSVSVGTPSVSVAGPDLSKIAPYLPYLVAGIVVAGVFFMRSPSK